MKKIFTLLVAVGIISFAQAQPGKNNPYDQRNRQSTIEKDYDYGRDIASGKNGFDKDSRYNTIISTERQRDLEIARINRNYDLKIQKVNSNFFKSRVQKRNQVRLLEAQRQQEIRTVYNKFSREQARYDRSKRRY